MSPGVPSYRAARGSDVSKLHECIFDALTKAQAATRSGDDAAPLAAIAQAAAIAALAAQVGRVADAIEADNAAAPALPMPAGVATRCPSCDHPRGFGAACNLTRAAGLTQQERCGCSHSFHATGGPF
jgi:hypothetical protein